MQKEHKLKSIVLKSLPHIAAIAIMYLLTIFYFSPVVLEEKALPQGDMISVQGMTKEVKDYEAQTGERSAWLNSMFSGMPSESLYNAEPFNIFANIATVLRGGFDFYSAGIFFSYLIGFYIFMMCLGANVWLGLLAAIAYALASYNLIIIDAGHITKAYAMAFIAPMIGGIILLYRKKYLLGFLVTLVFMGVEFSRNHIQITYYAGIMVGLLVISYLVYYLIHSIKDKESIVPFFKASILLLVATALAVLPSMGKMYPTYKYSKDTMRGGSELTITPDSQKNNSEAKPNDGGLEIDYAYAWSYGKSETFTLLVPNCYGSGHTMLDKTDPTVRELRNIGYGSTYLPTYWGDQPFTAGPVYVGAIVCFLFILGLFVVKGPEKWWVIAAVIISFVLAWGKNLLPLNEWLFHNLPFYNKFRTPSMALIIAGVAMPILGMMALKNIFSGKIEKQQAWKYTWISAAISAGLCIFVMLLGKTAFSYTGAGDANFQQQLTQAGFDQGRISDIMNVLVNYRESMLMKDAWRSFIFIALAFGTLALYCKNLFKKEWLPVTILSVLVLADMWPVDRRYLNDENFVSKKKVENAIKPTEADNYILQDKDINFRVLNLASNTFNESQTSYFHKSIGGYSPAKLRRYQDMIDFYISKDMQQAFGAVVQTQGNLQQVDGNAFKVLNMLNTKYFILPGQNGQTIPVENPHRYGNAWFVDTVKMVDSPDEEILAVEKTNIHNVAIVDKRWENQLPKKTYQADTNATIVNTLCNPNKLTYKVKTNTEQVVVFSEVFYDKGGWEAKLDGKTVPHFRTDYILRAMVVPAGEHVIEFNYVSHARVLGSKISSISSIICILIILGSIGCGVYRRKKEVVPEAK